MYGDIYAAGTATVAAGETVVVGSGTLWTATLEPYDSFEAGGARVTIISIEDNTHLTLAYGWPAAALAAAPYLVRLDSARRHEPTYLAGRVRDLVNKANVLETAAPTYAVIEVGRNAPPSGPVEDDAYIVGAAPSGAWAGHVGELAQWTGAAWLFSAPDTGWHAYDVSGAQLFVFTGAAWVQRDTTVLQFANAASFPAVGAAGVLYIAEDTDVPYYWSGSAYVGLGGAGTTDQVTEGTTNLYFTAARVRAVVLTGLSLAVGTAVTAADNLLAALGKLQKQITDLITDVADVVVALDGYEPLNANILKGDVGGSLTGGFSYSAVDDDGNGSGTYTPSFAGGNIKALNNNAAFTLGPLTSGYGVILLTITNVTGAGAITPSAAFEVVDGDPFDTTVGSKFLCQIIRMAGPIDWLIVKKAA